MRLKRSLAATVLAAAAVAVSAPAVSAGPINDIGRAVGIDSAEAHLEAARGTTIVVLGARLNPDCRPPGVLDQRLDRAAEFLRIHPANRVLVSGGETQSGCSTEAQAMETGLRARLVPNPIVRDDTAGSTVGNAEGAAARGVHRAVLVTSADHLPRAQATFAHAGVNTLGVAA